MSVHLYSKSTSVCWNKKGLCVATVTEWGQNEKPQHSEEVHSHDSMLQRMSLVSHYSFQYVFVFGITFIWKEIKMMLD